MRKEYNCATGEVTEHEDAPVIPQTPAEIAATASQAAKAALVSIDKASIRSMREWIALQPSAPQILKNFETSAVAERAKIV